MSGVTTIDPKADPWEHIRGKTINVSCGYSPDGEGPEYYVEADIPEHGSVERILLLASRGRKLNNKGDIVRERIREERT